MTGPLWSTPCACREHRLPYMTNVLVDPLTGTHRTTHCDAVKITLNPEPDTAPKPPPWTGSVFCEHGQRVWVTGPDPTAVLAELGCGCAESEVA